MVIDLGVQFSPEIILKILIRTRILSPFNFEITRMFETKLHSAYFKTFLLEPTAAPLDVRGHNTSSTSILVEWDDVPAFDQNGIITNYTITYRSLTEGHNGSAIAGPSDLQKELTDLKEYVDYDITVLASTSKGDGPESSPILVSTDQDSKYCSFPNLLSVINGLHPKSVCIFSILFPLHMQRC